MNWSRSISFFFFLAALSLPTVFQSLHVIFHHWHVNQPSFDDCHHHYLNQNNSNDDEPFHLNPFHESCAICSFDMNDLNLLRTQNIYQYAAQSIKEPVSNAVSILIGPINNYICLRAPPQA
jgi:hypothetical protein